MSAYWLDRPVLVTGATGLVGGWLVKRLVSLGADVVCLVRDHVPASQLLSTGLVARVKLAHADIVDQAAVERILGEHEINTVFHLAAQTIVGIANRNPVSTFESNIRGTWSVLEACRRSPSVRGIINASSDKAYGAQQVLPYDETTPLRGEHPYDVSKSCADLIASSYAHTYRLPVVTTRCGNFYGGGDLNWNRIIPGTIRSVIRGERPIIRSDGTLVRDYFYVEDGAYAYTMLAEALGNNPALGGEAFNFSNELRISVRDLVKMILDGMGCTLTPVVQNQAANEIRIQYLSARKARDQLGWAPQFTLEEGLVRTIEWYQQHLRAQDNVVQLGRAA